MERSPNAEKRNKILQQITDKCNYAFKPRLQCVIGVKGCHTEQYWSLIIHIDISRKIWYDCDQLKKVIIISVNGSFFTHFLKIHMKIVRVVTRQYNHRKPLK